MAEYSVTCPACGGTLHAHSEAEIIKMTKEHAKEHHDMVLTDDKVKEMIQKSK